MQLHFACLNPISLFCFWSQIPYFSFYKFPLRCTGRLFPLLLGYPETFISPVPSFQLCYFGLLCFSFSFPFLSWIISAVQLKTFMQHHFEAQNSFLNPYLLHNTWTSFPCKTKSQRLLDGYEFSVVQLLQRLEAEIKSVQWKCNLKGVLKFNSSPGLGGGCVGLGVGNYNLVPLTSWGRHRKWSSACPGKVKTRKTGIPAPCCPAPV